MEKTLLYKFIILVLAIAISVYCLERVADHYLNNNSFYKMSGSINTLILGHSQTECSLNDNDINNAKNISQSADSYFYIYYKLKKLTEYNRNIKLILLSCSDNMFSVRCNEWIYGDEFLSDRYPKYSHLLSTQDKLYLLYKNPYCYMNNYLSIFQKKLYTIVNNTRPVYREFNWGGYLKLTRNDMQRAIFEFKESAAPRNQLTRASEDINVRYLLKIVSYCRENNIDLIMIRTPQYKFNQRPFEVNLKNLLAAELADVPFWDYADFRLKDEEFSDFVHLNHKGAKIFSRVIDERLKALNVK